MARSVTGPLANCHGYANPCVALSQERLKGGDIGLDNARTTPWWARAPGQPWFPADPGEVTYGPIPAR